MVHSGMEGRFTINWFENLPISPFVWPDFVKTKIETATLAGSAFARFPLCGFAFNAHYQTASMNSCTACAEFMSGTLRRGRRMANIVDVYRAFADSVRSRHSDAASHFCPSLRHVCASVANFSQNFAGDHAPGAICELNNATDHCAPDFVRDSRPLRGSARSLPSAESAGRQCPIATPGLCAGIPGAAFFV